MRGLTAVKGHGIMSFVIISNSHQLGFSITSALKSVASTAYSVAKDPRAQALVAAAGQAYAPDTTSQVMQTAHQVQDKIRQARGFVNQGHGPTPPGAVHVPHAPPPPPPDDDGGDAGGDAPPLQAHHGLLLVGGAIGAVLLLVLLTK